MVEMKVPKIKNKFEVKCEVNSDVADMYMYGTIAKQTIFSEENTINSKDVQSQLKNITAKTIKVHVNSGGGDTFEAIAIGNILKQHESDIEIYIEGLAGSGASVIAMSGKVFMYTNSMFMAHKASTLIYGNSDELTKAITDLTKIDVSVMESYKSKFVGTDTELSTLISEATWLTAQECKDLGFCDEILTDTKETETLITETSIKDTIVNKYKKEIPKVEVEEEVETPVVEVPEETDLNLYNTFIDNFYK